MFPSDSIILLVTGLIIFLYWYVKRHFFFFKKHGIPFIEPVFLFGNTIDIILLRKSMAEVFADLYRKLDPHRFGGIFTGTKPMVLIRDPDLLKDILIKEFSSFSDRGWTVDKSLEPLSDHLFTMQINDWKPTRMKLNPVFTTGKIKTMFALVENCGKNLSEVVGRAHFDQPFDAKDLTSRYMTDVIASCVYGLEVNSLNDPNAEFRCMGRKLSKFRFRTTLRILELVPRLLAKLFKITFFDLKTQNFFGNITLKAIAYREKHNVKRNDLIDLLIDLKTKDELASKDRVQSVHDSGDLIDSNEGGCRSKIDLKITDELLASQGFIFFFAGFETTSTTLSYILLELSQNKTIQDKVRQEIVDVLSSNKLQITYDLMKKMTYTDMVIQETLRKYPPNSILQRRAIRDYKIPCSNVTIPAGTWIMVSIYGIHLDEKYYDNPHEFRPERFTEEEKSKRQNYTYLPFGDGPRYCIGARFAKMSVKVGLIYALMDYSYRVSSEMKFPLEFDKNLGLLTPANSILLERERIL